MANVVKGLMRTCCIVGFRTRLYLHTFVLWDLEPDFTLLAYFLLYLLDFLVLHTMNNEFFVKDFFTAVQGGVHRRRKV